MLPFPQTDARAFQDISAPRQDQLMADLHAAAAARERAITGASQDNGAQAWRRWEQYCKSVGCDNFYLDRPTQQERILMLGAFAMADREGRFLQECHEPLAKGTVQGTISHVVQAFRAKGRLNPTKDTDIKLLASFYQGRSEPTETAILSKCSKRPYHLPSLMI
jgi:hypothetical protein